MAAFSFPTYENPGAYAYLGSFGGFGVHPTDTFGVSRGWPSGGTAATSAPDAALLERITGDITSNEALATDLGFRAQAANTEATGYQREIEAYKTVGSIAGGNATYEGIAGNIKQLQAARSVERTIGKQRAETASAGFANSGSSLDILRSSMQEGYLQDQLIRSQTSINQSGYLQQAAAAEASAGGAELASNAALDLSRSYTAAGQLATATAAQQTSALQEYLKSTGGVNDPTRALVTSTLEQTPSQPGSFVPGAGAPFTGQFPKF